MSEPNSTAVQLDQVDKWFGPTVALEKVSLQVRRGDFAVLLGRNGAGKSTLLGVVARLVKPNAGRVEVCGFDVSREPHRVWGKIGLVGHSTGLYSHLTARENLRFAAELYGLNLSAQRITEALAWVGLEEEADRQVKGYSRGMQQRLAIARATLHSPELLLMDEPFAGLDWEAASLLAAWMKDFVATGKTILMATHDLEQHLEKANRWLLLDHGRMIKELEGDCHAASQQYKHFLQGNKSAIS